MSSTLKPVQIAKVVEILTSARMDKQVKLRFGYRRRDELAANIKAETVPAGDYRYGWLKDTRDAVVKLLGEKGEEFNKSYPFDCISLQDFTDVLNSATLLVKARQA
jgi:hypothetical protein